jgi:hypothetical protein
MGATARTLLPVFLIFLPEMKRVRLKPILPAPDSLSAKRDHGIDGDRAA